MNPTRYHCGTNRSRVSPDGVWPLRRSDGAPFYAPRDPQLTLTLPMEAK